LAIKKESYQYPVGLPGRLLLAYFTFIAQKFCFYKGESVQPNNGLAHPPAPFVPLRGTAGTFGVGQDGSGGTGEMPLNYRATSVKPRRSLAAGPLYAWSRCWLALRLRINFALKMHDTILFLKRISH